MILYDIYWKNPALCRYNKGLLMRPLERNCLLLAILFGLALWAGVYVMGSDLLVGDGEEYHLIADNLVKNGHYFTPMERSPWEASSARPAGYPTWLALIYAVVGVHPRAATFLQVFLWGILVAVLCRIAWRLFGDRAALFAGLVSACWLTGLLVSNTLHPDPVFGLLLLLGLWLLVRTPDAVLKPTLGAFALWGLATWFKPQGQVFPLYGAVGLVTAFGSVKKKVGYFLLALLIFGLIVTPWLVRNKQVFGALAFSTKADTTLLEWDAALIEAYLHRKSLDETRAQLWKKVEKLMGKPVSNPKAQFEVAKASKEVFLDQLKAQPYTYIGIWLATSITAPLVPDRILWFQLLRGHITVDSVREAFYEGGPLKALSTLYDDPLGWVTTLQTAQKLLVLWFAVPGFLVLIRLQRTRRLAWLFGLVIGAHCLMLGPDVMGRLMLIVDPLLILLASAGVARGELSAEAAAETAPG